MLLTVRRHIETWQCRVSFHMFIRRGDRQNLHKAGAQLKRFSLSGRRKRALHPVHRHCVGIGKAVVIVA